MEVFSCILFMQRYIKNHAPHLQRLYNSKSCWVILSTLLKNHAPLYQFRGESLKMIEITMYNINYEHLTSVCRSMDQLKMLIFDIFGQKAGPLFGHFVHFEYFGSKSGSHFWVHFLGYFWSMVAQHRKMEFYYPF